MKNTGVSLSWEEFRERPFWLIKLYRNESDATKCYETFSRRFPTVLFKSALFNSYFVCAYGRDDDLTRAQSSTPSADEVYIGKVRVWELLRTALIVKSNISNNIDEVVNFIYKTE